MTENFADIEAPAKEIETESIHSEMEDSYIEYAMSVIVGRSLPDVRDGLKPVHRRILYAMYKEGMTSNTSHRKSSNVVGETMGNYHPHGDSAIYDSLVRMAQDFSLRAPLIDGQGNFGSIDGDDAAAMRYTEARMSEIGETLLNDIEFDTVDMSPTYDDRNKEPDVLPAAFPNLLVNGSSGIAVGMSTKIPSHNLSEVVDAVMHRIKNPTCSVEDLHEHIVGPDFATGGDVLDDGAILKSYKTGKGKIKIRPHYHIEELESGKEQIVITEIPFEKEKSSLIKNIAEDVSNKELTSISDLRDESDRDGIRIVVELKRDAVTDVVVNKLINDKLVHTFGIILLALVDGEPKLLTLTEIIDEYIDHRKNVVRRRTEQKLSDTEEKLHKTKGKLMAVDNAGDVVEIIRNSKDRDTAIDSLTEAFDFTPEQATHVTRMQLGSLTSLDKEGLIESEQNLSTKIERYTEILESEDELMEVILEEQKEIKETYSSERQTKIITDYQQITDEDLLPEEKSIFVVSDDGYIKRVPKTEFKEQHRGGKGVRLTSLKQNDSVRHVTCASTHDTIYFFSESGKAYSCKGYHVPSFGRQARGEPLVQMDRSVDSLSFDDETEICAVTAVDEDRIDENSDFVFCTQNGFIKRVKATKLTDLRRTGINAITVEEDDSLLDVTVTNNPESSEVLLTSTNSKSIRFDLSEVSRVGRKAKGVSGIQLDENNTVISMAVAQDGPEPVLSVRSDGKGRLTSMENYSKQSRYGKGKYDIKLSSDTFVTDTVIPQNDTIFLVSKDGNILFTDISEVSSVGRRTVGVSIMNVESEAPVVYAGCCNT